MCAHGCCRGDVMACVANVTSKEETLSIIENITLKFLEAIVSGEDPILELTSRSEGNVIRDSQGHTLLGGRKMVKSLFGKRAIGSEKYAKIWQVLALVQVLVAEGKMITQRDAYYSLIQHFKSQPEFNDTLQDVVALTGCVRSSLGICASSSGAIAGSVLWKEEGTAPINCSSLTGGKKIPGQTEGVQFESLGARYILVVEKDAVFTYLCGQRIWDSLPCVLLTGCGYPSLSVRAVLKTLSSQTQLPIVGLFDYNPHGLQILLTYKFGSTRMGLEAHAHTVDIKWLGLHYSDLMDKDQRPKVEPSALQPWGRADQSVFEGVRSRVGAVLGPLYSREIGLMQQTQVKAEIEAINTSGRREMDTLENFIIHKILCKMYF